jgi:hypothetical protein
MTSERPSFLRSTKEPNAVTGAQRDVPMPVLSVRSGSDESHGDSSRPATLTVGRD